MKKLLNLFLAIACCLLPVACAIPDVPWHEERSKGADEITTEKKRAAIEHLIRRTEWTIEKFADDRAFASRQPYDVATIEGNLMLNEGINEIWTLVAGGGGTAYSNANARCGVGDSSAAEAATQTDLQAATNKLYKAQNASFPTTGSQQIVFKCDFGSSDANFAWNEFTVDNGSTPSKNLNRKVSSQGTKASGQTWTLTLTITLS